MQQLAKWASDLIDRHNDLVEKFLPIAERKVSTLDEYGDENWRCLDREIFRCIEKIAEAEGGAVTIFGSGRDYRIGSFKSGSFKTPLEIPAKIGGFSRFDWLMEGSGAYHIGLTDSSRLSIRENELGEFEVYRHIRGIRSRLWIAKDLKGAVDLAEREVSSTGWRSIADEWKVTTDESPELYQELLSLLEQRFRSYHAQQLHRVLAADEIERMTGVEFENYLMRVLKGHGCDVSGTPKTGDRGADIIARLPGRTIVIQAKRSTSPVGNKAVQEVFAALAYYGGTEAWVITNATFTQGARELADRNRVHLVCGADLPRVSGLLGGQSV